jgi:hypothetical protein
VYTIAESGGNAIGSASLQPSQISEVARMRVQLRVLQSKAAKQDGICAQLADELAQARARLQEQDEEVATLRGQAQVSSCPMRLLRVAAWRLQFPAEPRLSGRRLHIFDSDLLYSSNAGRRTL